MINNFWIYFFITPVVVSIIALNSLFVHKSPSTPVFENALEYCQSVDNNFVYSDQGTAQDICIDEYMNAPWALELVTKIFLLFGFLFIVPLIFYLRSR
jgi:hypothetical protein